MMSWYKKKLGEGNSKCMEMCIGEVTLPASIAKYRIVHVWDIWLLPYNIWNDTFRYLWTNSHNYAIPTTTGDINTSYKNYHNIQIIAPMTNNILI